MMALFVRREFRVFYGMALAVAIHSVGFAAVIPEFRGMNGLSYPSEREIRALGQLGGALNPTPVTAKTSINEDNRAFGLAMNLWNTHAYAEARGSLSDYLIKFPGGRWAGEAMLHLGCEARFNGRLSESESIFSQLVSQYKDSEEADAQMVVEKAVSRLAEQKLLQNQREDASRLFSQIATKGKDWRHRTYASHWIQRMSRERRQGAALATCGGQALSHLLEQDGRIDEARALTRRLPPDKNGFSLHDLSLLAKAYGYDGVALNIGLDDLPRLDFPAIVHIQRGDASLNGHYWVIESLDQDRITLFDAQEPRRFVQTLSEFAREWNGDILAFGVPSELAEKRLPLWEAESIYGACCGEQRPEGDLGPPDECNLDSNGCPDWTVNMLNLNLYMTDTPLWYQPAYGPEVSFKLSYNSQSALARNEIFGNKWSFEYGAYLVEDPGNSVIVFMGSGKRLVFVQNPDGSYLRRPGNFETLNKIDATTYELKQPDGVVLRFAIPSGTSSQQPFLTQVRDAEGHSLSFEYDQQVRLVGVVDVHGRRTVLEYNANRQVVRITDPFGRTALFSYDTADNLTQIVDMAGYVSQMTYDLDANLLSLSKPEAGTWQFYFEPADGDDSIGFNPYPPFGSAMWENYRITVTHPDGEKEEFHYDGLNADSWHVPPGGYNHVSPGEPLSKFNYHIDGFSARLGRVSMAGEDIVAYAYDGFRNNFIKSDEVLTLWRTFNSDNQKISETRNPFGSSQQTTHFEYLGPTSPLRTRILRESVYSGGQYEQTMQYNSGGNPTQITLRGFTPDGTPMERVYQYTYDSLGRLIEENGPRTDVSDITLYTYFTCDSGETDGHCDRLATITNALGHTTTINSYTANGLISQMTDPNGKITVYTYDGLDRLTSVTERSEPTGTDRTTLFTYTGPKRLASVSLPDGASLTYTYDSTEKLVSITDNLANKIEYINDANGNRIEEKVYDASNNLVRLVENVYDLRNRKTSVSSGGIVTQYGSYRNNLIGQIVDGRSNATAKEYDGFGQLVKITPPVGSIVTYQYNVHGNIIQVVVANGPVTNYTYDDFGNLLREVSPDRGTIHWTYDVAGNRISQIDGRNVAVSFNYDALNRLIQETYPDNSTVSYQYDTAPNGIGRLASVTDFSGSTTFAYNTFGQMVQKLQTVAVGTGSTTLAMQFEYDAVGRLTKKTYPSGLEAGYGYDAVGRISQIRLDGEPWLSEIRYQPFGGVTELHWADGRTTARTYDLGGKLIGHALDTDQRAVHYDLSGNIQGLTDSSVNRVFGYDPVNRLTSAQGFTEEYIWQYDGNSNRISEQQGTSTDTYSYAATTNRLQEITGSGTSQFDYDGAGNMTSNGSTAYTYNIRGQLSAVSSGTTAVASYQYNGFNQRVLKSVDGEARIFVYDTDGMLLSEHEASGSTIVQYVNFNGEVLAARTDDQAASPPSPCQGITAKVSDHMGALRAYVTTEVINGVITVSYRAHGSHDRLGSDALATVTLYANGFNFWQLSDPGNCGNTTVGPCPATTSSNQEHKNNARAYTQTTGAWWWTPSTTTYYAQGSNNNLGTSGTTITTLYQGVNGSWYVTDPANCPIEQLAGWLYYHNDHLGTPQKVTNADGDVVWAATINPFGDVIETVSDFEQNIRFPGQYHDRETGLYYNWHRYYSPELGRYITSDPIGLAGGLNTYAYVGGNPISRFDFSGLKYSDEECRLLAEFIDNQRQMLGYYNYMYEYGRPKPGVKTTTIVYYSVQGVAGCRVFLDEGRRLACEAHEKTHDQQNRAQMVAMPLAMFHKLLGMDELFNAAIAFFEIFPTKNGIAEAERLFKENCGVEECKGESN